MRTIWVSALVALSVTSCGTPEELRTLPAPLASSRSASGASVESALYEANATVLENDEQGPMLCLGGIMDSLPPQCGDIPAPNWDWDDVTGEERQSGVTWGGAYHVTGRFDGDTFTLTERPGPPVPHLDPKDDFSSEPACEEPEQGWITEGNVDQEAAGRALSGLRSEPDYSAGWITQLEPPGEYEDTGPVVLNAAFTGDLERHEADLRARWEGSLCVVRYDRSLDELERVRRSVDADLEGIGVHMLYSDLDEVGGSLNYHVAYLSKEDRRTLEERYGRELLDITTALIPLSPN
jgi:hypothetical protein